ncbi:MAG TPA: cupin domain-containing protein [Firmicutes bacterium]|nr:cupin domain-containing protein [Bacillota bacterium]
MQIGPAIRNLRTQKKLTLKQFAAATGLSQSLISQVERDLASPSVVSLWKMAKALDVPVGYFFESAARENCVVRRHERKRLMFSSSKVIYELLSPRRAKNLEFLMIHIEPGEESGDQELAHPGEECGVVISGRLEVELGEEKIVLEEGDSIYFESTIPHRLRNPGTEPVVAVWVDYPPMF